MVERRVSETEDEQVSSLETQKQLDKTLTTLQAKVKDLEARSRCNNLRFKMQSQFLSAKCKLQELKMDYDMLYRAHLYVTVDGKYKIFNDLRLLQQLLKKCEAAGDRMRLSRVWILGTGYLYAVVLYSEPNACVCIKRIVPDPISITRGMHEAWPLPPLLYAFVVEPLAGTPREYLAHRAIRFSHYNLIVSAYTD
ncbi:hypothetical protein NDU88_005378 [Pleurodeles waltl]|uniref:Uncharacterized protein n=1 Tax=Pleurodeles waltl TaxID=8319 RepID=A0AAV7TAM2_PLEWA|nr:hypothetical protein NDU88_005378 [Pleurodeles waltl]